MADDESHEVQEVKFERPPGSSHFNLTMASALISGGAFAYYKSRSVPSLAAGVILGSAFAFSGEMIKNGENIVHHIAVTLQSVSSCMHICKSLMHTVKGDHTRGHGLALGTGATLAGMMGYRFFKTRQVVPTGVLAVLGVASTIYNAQKVNEWMD